MYFDMFVQFQKTLGQMKTWLDKADAHATELKFDSGVLAATRLTPSQLPLIAQVLFACDTAKLGASRLTGKEAPKHGDEEKTIGDLRARIDSTLTYLGTFTAKDFEETSTRSVTQPRWEGKVMTGHDYFFEHVVPNFFFHAAHAYAILRASGVAVGKRDYLGTLSQRQP